jgi:hypothetical protein
MKGLSEFMALELVRNLLRSELNTCENKVDLWKADHELAMVYFNICDLVREANDLFERLTKFDDDFRNGFYNDPGEYDDLIESQVDNLFRRWTDVVRAVVEKMLPWAEGRYDGVEGSDKLRRYLTEAAGINSEPAEFFQADGLVKFRDDAIDEYLNGQGSHI